jgi:Xaa-Pro aminopeptidase
VTGSTTAAPPSIPDAEFEARGRRAQELMADRGLDVLLVNSNEADASHVRYLSDYNPVFESAGVLVPASGPLTLLIGAESETFATDRSRIPRIRMLAAYRESADPEYPDLEVTTFGSVFDEAGHPRPTRIGIAGSFATNLVMLDDLREAFPQAELVRADDILVELRSVKSDAELACLREAFRISELAIDAVLQELRPGLTELEVVGIAVRAMYENGAEAEGMPQYVLSGPNSRHAISRATHRTLQPGEMVQLNLSARVAGYSSGVGRPVFLGKAAPSQRDVVEFCREAHLATIEWLSAGVVASDIAKRYRQYFVDRRREDLFLYGPCHGLGLMEVEAPWMETTSDYAIAEGTTYQVDSFALSPEVGVRWENGVRVVAGGVEQFSERNMEVIELG